jgi:hypothetical protein
MLASPNQIGRQQLLDDLTAVRQRLSGGWVKGAFQQGENVCIVAACQGVTDSHVGTFTKLAADSEAQSDKRLGRLIYKIYTTLYGEKADKSLKISAAMSEIARFNDSKISTKESVILLLDRAIERVMAPAEMATTA